MSRLIFKTSNLKPSYVGNLYLNTPIPEKSIYFEVQKTLKLNNLLFDLRQKFTITDKI